MCKFTTIILLLLVFLSSPTKITAQHLDFQLLKSIYDNKNTVALSKAISYTTTITAFGVPVAMAGVALLKSDDELLKNALYTTASIGIVSVLTYSLKYSINRRRPYLEYPNEFVRLDAYSGKSPSFPSGHTSLAFTTATALSLKYPKWYVIAPSYAWAGYVGYSRMNLGVHYPSDVITGALLGAGSAWLTYEINEWYWNEKNKRKSKHAHVWY